LSLLISVSEFWEDEKVWRQWVQTELPEMDVRVYPDDGDVNEIKYVATWKHPHGILKQYPNLKAILSLGAGVDHILSDPDLPEDLPIVRLVDPKLTHEMCFHALHWVLHFHSDHFLYMKQQMDKKWQQQGSIQPEDRTVGIMGLGNIGRGIGDSLVNQGFKVLGWGANQNYVQSALHTPSSYGATINHGGQYISNAITQFNVYTLEWTSEQMIFSVNGYIHYTYNPDTQNSETWPFDSPQYLLMNIAIEPSIASSFTETEMELDYVRVYEISILSSQAETVPNDFNAIQNNPNPFNPVTTLRYKLPRESFVNITIYNMLGNLVNNLVSQKQIAGYKSVQWNATNNKGQSVPAGVYLYTIQAGEFRQTKKMVLLK